MTAAQAGVPVVSGPSQNVPAPVNPYGAQAQQYYQMLDQQKFMGQMQNSPYTQAFQQALGGARSSIQQQLGAALGDIANSQRAAGQALSGLPAGINAAYDQANGNVMSSVDTIQKAQQSAGLGNPQLGDYLKPEQAAVNTTRGMLQANVPLLNEGIQEMGSRERAMANMAAMGQNQQLDQMSMQNALQQQGAYQQFLYQRQLQDDPSRNFGPGSTQASNPVVDPKTGMPTGFTQQQVIDATNSPQYGRIQQELAGAKDQKTKNAIWHQLQTVYSNNPALLAAIQASNQGLQDVGFAANRAPGALGGSIGMGGALQAYGRGFQRANP